MTYLDHGATSFPKPPQVTEAVGEAMVSCANPGRGSHPAARAGAEVLYRCREAAGELFHIQPEHVVLTMNCTQGLNMAIRTLVRPGDWVVISGFEHNAVTRPLRGLGARVTVAGRRLFDWEDTLREFKKALDQRPKCAVFTHVSNVFGYILPIEEMARECRRRGIPFIVDAAQSAGAVPMDFEALGADFVAMPGHKGLLGPMGTGLLLCGRLPRPLLMGGTGSESESQIMPDFLPDRAEAGTANVPGFAGLEVGIRLILEEGPEAIGRRESALAAYTARELGKLGYEVFAGPHQLGTVSFRGEEDCQTLCDRLPDIALRAGLHCAPLAHKSAGTLDTGTVRASFGWNSTQEDAVRLLEEIGDIR
ncbi:MAG: aminotransferase class V-fold PLP-dependent enzyme [Oscillospiraceae bacterium]|nr:aminotransferase class V-fold PLP-dependent enzyme [Oscillospiraceae bacterium]